MYKYIFFVVYSLMEKTSKVDVELRSTVFLSLLFSLNIITLQMLIFKTNIGKTGNFIYSIIILGIFMFINYNVFLKENKFAEIIDENKFKASRIKGYSVKGYIYIVLTVILCTLVAKLGHNVLF